MQKLTENVLKLPTYHAL